MLSSVLLFLLLPGNVLASCAGPMSLQEYKERADVIVVGKVTERNDEGHASLVVDKYYKGHGPNTISFTGRENFIDVTSIDFKPEVGKTYLLFLSLINGGLKTNACDGNKVLTNGLLPVEEKVLEESQLPSPAISPTPVPNGIKFTWQTFMIGLTLALILMAPFFLSAKKSQSKTKKKNVKK